MRDNLDAVAAGEVSPEAAEAQLRGYATGDAGFAAGAQAGLIARQVDAARGSE